MPSPLCPVSTVHKEKSFNMYYYIPKSQYGEYADQKMAPSIDALLVLCKAGEVERVIIPMTYYGYGASLIDDSNRRSIKRHYAENRFKDVQYSLTCSGYQFKKHEWLRDLIEELTEQYPVFDESDYSQLEDDTKREFIIDELYLDDDINSDMTLDKEQIAEILFSGESWNDRIEYWEYCEIDNDGLTPYMSKDNFETLRQLFLAKRDAMKADKE